jgi:ribosome maturation factor RimP
VGLAHFFYGREAGIAPVQIATAATQMTDLKADIQQQLTELDSSLDLVALEQPGSESLRLFIDHPDGVDLALCERITHHLNHLRADYALEVSSPGPKYRRQSTSESKESSQ